MAVVHLRIDDRLIHGQVTTAWLGSVRARKIIIASDAVAKDELRKKVVSLTAPKSVKTEVLEIDTAASLLTGPLAGENERVMVICSNPEEVVRLVNAGVDISSVNVGNMGGIGSMQGARNRVQIFKSVSVDESDVAMFKELNAKGIKCTVRVVPQDRGIDVMELIKSKWEGN